MVSQFMRQNISLSKFAGRAKAPPQLVEKREVDVNLLIFRTIKRARSGFRTAASRFSRIAEEHQLGVAIRPAGLLRQELRPGLLRVIQYEGNKLHQRFFRGIASRIRLADSRAGIQRSAAQQRKQVGPENETENQQNNSAADS